MIDGPSLSSMVLYIPMYDKSKITPVSHDKVMTLVLLYFSQMPQTLSPSNNYNYLT